jgi:hypothetical protein
VFDILGRGRRRGLRNDGDDDDNVFWINKDEDQNLEREKNQRVYPYEV